MPHRDPQTGQFLPHDEEQYDDIEVATFGANLGVQAGDLWGITTIVELQREKTRCQVRVRDIME